MERNTSQDPASEHPRRLTRVERARLEALKSFGCEDFGSVLHNSRKISLKSKLKPSQASNDEENAGFLKETRKRSQRSQSFQNGKHHARPKRLTKAELARIDSLKSFQNNSLADITNSSKRIISKFFNKPAKKCQNESEITTTEVLKISCNPEDIPDTVNMMNSYSGTSVTSDMISNECDEGPKQPLDTTGPKKSEIGLTEHIQMLLDTNDKVLKVAMDLDLHV